MRLIAVFDTNVLFSGMGGWKGGPYRCLEAVRAGKIEHVTCLEILSELESKLRTKLYFSSRQAALTIADIVSVSKIVSIPGSLKAVPNDPDDDKILECAVAGGASHIVTGDRRHLLPLKSFQNIAIVDPSSFLEIVQRSGRLEQE
jgi:uncharacterized protein